MMTKRGGHGLMVQYNYTNSRLKPFYSGHGAMYGGSHGVGGMVAGGAAAAAAAYGAHKVSHAGAYGMYGHGHGHHHGKFKHGKFKHGKYGKHKKMFGRKWK
jgi:hypothetical protein